MAPNNPDIDVLYERSDEHERRITVNESLTQQNSAAIGNILIVSERHNEQIGVLSKTVYGFVFLVLSSIMAHFWMLK